jgi:4-nitrophenyl phosphatase
VIDPARRAQSVTKSPAAALRPAVLGLILDMDGVLWKSGTPIGDLRRIFSTIEAQGWKVVVATNNATRKPQEYADQLNALGVDLDQGRIVTSADATAGAMAGKFPDKGVVFVVGGEGLMAALLDAGFDPTDDPEEKRRAIAVVAGMDQQFTYGKMEAASRCIRGGAAFYATNPDPTFPTPQGLIPGAGAVVAAIAAASQAQPTVIGKPGTLLFELAARRLDLPRRDVLVVGDRLETDIAGGQAWGARTALVLSGVSSREEAEQWSPAPEVIVADLAELVGA